MSNLKHDKPETHAGTRLVKLIQAIKVAEARTNWKIELDSDHRGCIVDQETGMSFTIEELILDDRFKE